MSCFLFRPSGAEGSEQAAADQEWGITIFEKKKSKVNQSNVTVHIEKIQTVTVYKALKGALGNILKFSFWLNFINQVKIDC